MSKIYAQGDKENLVALFDLSSCCAGFILVTFSHEKDLK